MKFSIFIVLILKKKMEVGLCDLHAVCISPAANFRIPEPIFMKLGTYIMAAEPISTAYFINSSHQPVSVCVSRILLGNGSAKKRNGGNEYTRNNRRIVGRVVFSAVHVVSKESRRLILPRTFCFLS
jgi:hypothetical protein